MYDSIIILGPTATGKTNLAINLAKKMHTEIINADSMYVYTKFNIGTAKPSQNELSEVKHHLVDFLDPSTQYSVANFREDAKSVLSDFSFRNLIPIIVGGTGFYIDSLIKSYSYGNTEKNIDVRNQLLKEQEEFGNDFLYDKLMRLDKESAIKLHKNDTKRIIRALEICMTSNSCKSTIINEADVLLKNPLIIGLNPDRDKLYERINLRVDNMINDGLIDEVKSLYSQGYLPENCNAMKGIGYKEIVSYLNGEYSLSTAIDKIKQHTRNYAKRQITWFKRNKDIIWFDSFENDLVNKIFDLFNK